MAKTKKKEKNKNKTNVSENLGWDPPSPSKESRNIAFFVFFSKVFTQCVVFQGNWNESQAKLSKYLGECNKTSQNISLNHGKIAFPGTAVLHKKAKKHHEWINDCQTHAMRVIRDNSNARTYPLVSCLGGLRAPKSKSSSLFGIR